jgi:hypothetical protein
MEYEEDFGVGGVPVYDLLQARGLGERDACGLEAVSWSGRREPGDLKGRSGLWIALLNLCLFDEH